MSEEQEGQQQPEGGKAEEFKPITSQDELNRIIGERVKRAKPADYDELRTKAEQFDKVQEANKSELQKAQERAEAAERRAEEFEQTALKTRIAVEMGVIPEVINGADEEAMRKSAQRVLDWASQGKKPTPKPTQLASGSAPAKGGEQGRAAAALRALRQG